MENKEMLAKQRMVVLQNFAETNLFLNGQPSSSEVFQKPDVFGELNEEQARLLRNVLRDEFATYDSDLEKYVTSRGDKFEPGKLSKTEIDLLIKQADKTIVFLDVLSKRAEAHLAKKDN